MTGVQEEVGRIRQEHGDRCSERSSNTAERRMWEGEPDLILEQRSNTAERSRDEEVGDERVSGGESICVFRQKEGGGSRISCR